jgi:tRNA nucleotidyltransferase (CCA-adding enzyme)
MKTLLKIAQKFQNNNKNLYIVGGFCRDRILNIHNSETDIDFTTDALPEEVQKITKCIWHIWKKYWTQLILDEWETYEITTFRSDIGILDNRKPVEVNFTTDINLDAKRRDFTCNAIYFNPISEDFIDPEKWILDLENKIIRFIWNPEDRIREDALRILRFIRFKNKYSLSPAESNYFKIIRNNIWLLKNISKERIKDELDKILLWINNIQALKDLKEIWFFTVFLEELEKQSETPGNSHHLEWDVWTHTLMTIEYLNTMKLSENKTEKLDLYWTMLLHDYTKPLCYSLDQKWEWHYYWHEKSGAELFKSQVSKQLPFSKKSIHKIAWIIENHLRIFKIFEMKKLKSRQLMMHKYWKDLMIIWEADHMWRLPSNYNLIEKLHIFYKKFLIILQDKVFYTGEDIMKEFPDLEWLAIWNKLKEINNKILIQDIRNR